ncbi:hypothetical protein ANAPC5_01388 [Anaplasma phagocytophilum]|nr:hypothetical protein ANAPC5_01388 [Anaplasma phagocytophilum]
MPRGAESSQTRPASGAIIERVVSFVSCAANALEEGIYRCFEFDIAAAE